MAESGEPRHRIDWTPEAGERLDQIITRAGGLSAAARIAGKSDDALMRWRRGEARWDCWSIARLCAAAGRSLDWVVFGDAAVGGSGRIDEQSVLRAADFVLRAASQFPTLEPEEIAQSIVRRAKELDEFGSRLTDGASVSDQYSSR